MEIKKKIVISHNLFLALKVQILIKPQSIKLNSFYS